MAFTIRPVQYFYVNVRDELGAAYQILSQLAQRGVGLLAFSAVPAGPMLAQFALFPAAEKLVAEARSAGMTLDGPHHALLVQGDDELGALADVHERLLPGRGGRLRVGGRDRRPRLLRLPRVRARGPDPAGRRRARPLAGLVLEPADL